MNIFYLDEDPYKVSEFLPDLLLNKMLIEACQMLVTTDILRGMDRTWKPTHENHPCRLSLENIDNYNWLVVFVDACCDEWMYRFHKRHKCADFLSYRNWQEAYLLYNKHKTPSSFPKVMPERFVQDSTIDSYRAYLKFKVEKYLEKGLKVTWTNRTKPEWI